ncbi:MAG: DUF4358 domain-containing protein [Ruminococcus sp.]|nr:DUF4358 domain-containing protein [Ruminococcus sp.]
MKRIVSFVCIIMCITLMITLSACKGDASKEVVLKDVLASINSNFSISADDMLTIEDTDTLELYYNISPADVKQFAAETTLNSATDITEVILVEATDESAAKRVYDALDVRYNSQRDLCASYSAELLAVINECSVEQNGNYICLIMSDDFDNILAHYKSFFK